jgi:hypothetical protein
MVGPAELLLLRHLRGENGSDGGIIEAIPVAEPPVPGFETGRHQKVSVLSEIEGVLEQERNVRHEQGRRESAGGSQRFKTFLPHPGMNDRLKVPAGRRIAKNGLPERRAVDRARRTDHPPAKPGTDGGNDGRIAPKQAVHTGIRVEDHRTGANFPKDPARGRFPAGDPAAEAEDEHGPRLNAGGRVGQR